VRRRLTPARRLFRDGVIVDATVQSVTRLHFRGSPLCRATLRFRLADRDRIAALTIGGHPPEITEGATIVVLSIPDYTYCATFPIRGRMFPASLR
jgi:hypothetical protein